MEASTSSFTLRHQILIVLFLVPLMVFVALWHLLLQSTVVVRESAVWSAGTAEVFRLIDSIETGLTSAGDEEATKASLAKLEALVVGNAGQMDRVQRLRREGVGTARVENRELVLADLAAIRREQVNLIPDRVHGVEGGMFRLELASLGLFALDLVVLVCAGYLVWKLLHLRSYATACAWTQTILHEGEWISFEQYLKHRFGIQLSHGICPEALEKIERGVREAPPQTLAEAAVAEDSRS